MSDDVIKSFLVGLGFKIDEAQARKFNDAIESATKGVAVLAVGLEAAAVATVGMVQRVSSQFEQLSYASSRIGSSATHIREFRYAISQLGGTAEGAMSSLEAFGRKLRESPGVRAQLKAYGVTDEDFKDNITALQKAISSSQFRALLSFTQLHIAEQSWGLDERTFRAMLGNVDRFTLEYREKLKKAGLDPDVAAANSKKFEQSWRSMLSSVEMIFDRVATNLSGGIGAQLDRLTKFVDRHGAAVARGLEAIGTALLNVAEFIAGVIVKIGELQEPFDRWAKQTLGIEDGFGKLAAGLLLLSATRIPALIASLTGLVFAPAWRGLMLGLAALGLPGAALALGAIGAEAAKAYGSVPGADEKAPEGAIEKGADSIDKWVTKKWRERPTWLGGSGGGASSGKGGWWTSDREQHAVDYLKQQGVSDLGARALVSRWRNVEASGGPGSRNSIGAWGIAQWLGGRKRGIDGDADFDHQLAHVAKELHSSESRALGILNAARTPWQAAQGASAFERAEGWNAATNTDNFTGRTAKGIAAIGAATKSAGVGFIGPANAASQNAIANWHNAGKPGPYPGQAPIGHPSHNSIRYGHHINAKNTFNLNGVSDPKAVAKEVVKEQTRVNADLIRNMQSASH